MAEMIQVSLDGLQARSFESAFQLLALSQLRLLFYCSNPGPLYFSSFSIYLAIDLAEDDIDASDYRADVGNQMSDRHLTQRLQIDETGRTAPQPVRSR